MDGASLAALAGMRALLLTVVAAVTACTDHTLPEDTAYRRLFDRFDSEAQCIAEGDFSVCYQTLTLCESGLVRLDLANWPKTGEYRLFDGRTAVAEFIDMQLEFDLETRTSVELPGRHPWEEVHPLLHDCAPGR